MKIGKTETEKEYVKRGDTIYNPHTRYIGNITGESDNEYIVEWFYNPRNGCGDYRVFLKKDVKE